MTTTTHGDGGRHRAGPGIPLRMPALVSPVRVHLPWMIGMALAAALLVMGLYLAVATRFSATVQIAFDAGGRTIPVERLEAYLSTPARLGATVDRLALAQPTEGDAARLRAMARLWQGIEIEQSDLTNVFLLRTSGGARRKVAPVANALADTFVRADSPRSNVHVRIISPATDPVAPDGMLILPIAAALLSAALAASITLIVRERRQEGPRSARSAEAALGLPVIAMIPAVTGLAPGDRATLTDMPVTAQQSDYARAFRRLLASGQPGGRVIAVCSALAGEGKSTFAISLARTAALAGRRVALVDGDGRVRAASIALDVVGRPGLVQVMDGAVTLDDALVADTRTSLRILPHSQDAAIRSFWAKDSMAGLLAVTGALSRAFDLVVIDTPPLLALVEARDIASVADEALVVARWRATPLGALRHARSMLAEKGTRASLVLSFVRLAEPDRAPIVPMARRRGRTGPALAGL
ncbi:CpsD/CapB family tyrosine-protein kinase [Sphingomonas sp. AP4-R1]|uniref:polysaccharide biosynthesis tyrosine autokinase n=1 Tax=Sphingomonas sp. AP4-R1 TaxID=2735134 RepID=UPI001493D754|nr:CpsD/CapB family tyrosine-protein kinase [Sphingomonas sp. AP4-R1]QJU58058.1 CpsD/CapB family tyrosine-protein kinase [Sphingomonas sp. AP4-R1]